FRGADRGPVRREPERSGATDLGVGDVEELQAFVGARRRRVRVERRAASAAARAPHARASRSRSEEWVKITLERVLDSEPHDPGGWNQHDLSVGRARHIGCGLSDVGIQRVDGVHARFESPLTYPEGFSYAQIHVVLDRSALTSERFEAEGDRAELSKWWAAQRVGGAKHVRPLAFYAAERRQRSSKEDVKREGIAAVEPELVIPRFVQGERVLVRVFNHTHLNPLMLFRCAERAPQAPSIRQAFLRGDC